MQIQKNVKLSHYTTFEVGGPAEQLVILESTKDLRGLLQTNDTTPRWLLGFGANVVISDQGLPGLSIILRAQHGSIRIEDGVLIADAATWWDDVVNYTIEHNLWGLELMSYIPGGVGAAIVGNIAAYGQAVSDSLVWVDVLDPKGHTHRLAASELDLTYRSSAFQTEKLNGYTVLQAAFKLSATPTTELRYQAALAVAEQLGIDASTLARRRRIIKNTRLHAGSIYLPDQPNQPRTAGSFFRNPIVTPEQAEQIVAFDETGRTKDQLDQMNQVHGGDTLRVSAAHVLLAAGFKRGQTWGPVRLHPDHVLKIENTGGATAQQIYDVSQEIIMTVRQKLDIIISPEIRFLGDFYGGNTR